MCILKQTNKQTNKQSTNLVYKLSFEKENIDRTDKMMAELGINAIEAQRVSAQEYERQKRVELAAQTKMEKEIRLKRAQSSTSAAAPKKGGGKRKAQALAEKEAKNKPTSKIVDKFLEEKNLGGSKKRSSQKKLENNEKNDKNAGFVHYYITLTHCFFLFVCSVCFVCFVFFGLFVCLFCVHV